MSWIARDMPPERDDEEPRPYTEEQIKLLLDQLAEHQAAQDALRLEKQALLDGVLTPEIRQQMADIETEYADKELAAKAFVEHDTECVRAIVPAFGRTVTGAHLQAKFVKGRVSWDSKALDGYAAGHPEIAPFRKEGAPSVSICKVNGK